MRAEVARSKWCLHAVVILLWLATTLSGQMTITGRVTDENGNAVAGARIEFREATQHWAATTTSDVQGFFKFHLPAAGYYSIHIEKQGFFVLDKPAFFTSEGEHTVGITLNHLREFIESIDVKYSPPAIDPTETSEQKRLDTVEILEVPFPASHDLRNALPMFLGVVQDNQGRPHFNGGATDQANVTLDGFDLTDPGTGQLNARVSIDAVRSLDFESARFSADKGRGSAGTLDIKTDMGDDRWRFAATNFIPSLSSKSGLFIDKWTPRFTLSGPISRGRAWFYDGFDTYYDVTTISGLPHGQDQSRSVTTNNLARFQVNLSASNVLSGSYLLNYIDANRQGLSSLDPVETTTNQRQTLSLAAIKDQIYFHSGALLELGFAFTRGMARRSPQGSAIYVISPSGRSGNYFEDSTRHTEREQGIVGLFLPPWQRFGKHHFKVGVDFEARRLDEKIQRHDYLIVRVDGSLARRVSFAGKGLISQSDFGTSAYALDRWTVREGLELNLGVRLDWDGSVHDSLVAPRLSLAWTPKLFGGTKLAAGYGSFADTPNLLTLAAQQDQKSITTFYSPDGEVYRGPITATFMSPEQSLKLPRARAASLSVERALPHEIYSKVSYQRRMEASGFTFAVSSPSPSTVMYLLKNARANRYDAVELSLRRPFAGQYEVFAGYTWSRARSNAVVDYSLDNPIYASQGPGPLDWDAPHRLLSWGWAPVPGRLIFPGMHWLFRNTDVMYLAEARTGFPFSVVNESGFMVGAANSRRFPSYFMLNLHLERKFRFMHYQWGFRYGVFNLTGRANPNVVNNVMDSPSFLTYAGGQKRAFNVRIRFLGRK